MSTAPRLARLLLRILLPLRDREFIIGDIDEEHATRAERDGRAAAWWWYWRQAIASLVSEAQYEAGDAPTVSPGEPRRGNVFDAMRQDARYALRALNQRPLFTSVAVLTLALGIGANTGIFSIANWLLLRPVPGIAGQKKLVEFEFAEAPGQPVGISWQNLSDIRKSASSFAGMAGSAEMALQLLLKGSPSISVRAAAVGGDYFGVLGVRTRLGRLILSDETAPGYPVHVALISENLWRTLFQADPAVVGRHLTANKTELTIVGVAADGFRGINRSSITDVWVPYSLYAELRHMDSKIYGIRGTGFRMFETVGRLKPGITVKQAQADLDRALAAIIAAYPTDNEIYKERPARVHPGIGVRPIMRERVQGIVRLMLILVGFLLTISCANVASMLLARGVQRRGESAVRRALGASGSRLAGQFFLESLLLALLGSIAGLVVAGAFLKLMEGGQLLGLPPFENIPLDWRVLLFTLTTCLGMSVLFGVVPLLGIGRLDLNAELHGTSMRHTKSNRSIRQTLVIGQITLSLMLVVGVLLLGRTLNALFSVDVGFDPARLAGTYVSTEAQGYDDESLPLLGERLLERVRGSAAVQSAALSSTIPFGHYRRLYRVQEPATNRSIHMEVLHVSDGYFETAGVPILTGRPLEVHDWVRAPKNEINIVLSSGASARLFGRTNPIGRIVKSGSFRGDTMLLTVVGVARDVRLQDPRDANTELMYWPVHTVFGGTFAVIAKSRSSAAALEPELQRALAAVDPAIPLQFQTVQDNLGESISEQRVLLKILSLFSLLAVLLSAVGLYGVLATAVAERRREFGIRLALGAHARDVLSLVVTQSAQMVLVGLIAGIVCAVWLSKLLQAQLFGVSRFSGSVYLAAAVVLGVFATIATAIPARAATRLDPGVALRQE